MIRKIERADGTRWQVYGNRNGEKFYLATYDSHRAARDADEDRRSIERKIRRGELPAEVDSRRTIRTASDAWLEQLKAEGSRSHRAYKARLTKYILPELGDAALDRLTVPMLTTWLQAHVTVRKLSPSTANTSLGCLQALLTYCKGQGWVASNVCSEVELLDVPEREYVWLTSREEFTKLVAACPPTIRDVIAMALGTGMRIDELLHLQWVDVNLERRRITVKRGRQGPTKNGKARQVPILDGILPLLRELALKRGGSVLVFPGRGGRPRSKPSINRPFNLARAKAGIADGFRVHDCRHSFASLWVAEGGSIFLLAQILGHRVEECERTYAHLSPDVFDRDLDRVGFVLPHVGERPALSIVP